MSIESFSEFIATQSADSTIVISAPNTASPIQVENICKKVLEAQKKDINNENIYAAQFCICALLQMGAASPKFDPNKTFTANSITVDNKTLKKAINDIDSSLTPRKVARALRDDIAEVGRKKNIPGNLSKSYQLQHPNAQISDLIWVSDFQTFNNNNSIPIEVKEWLLENYNNRFEKTKK
jgi:hypothetical protein